jgi:hypothetical protein
MNKFRGYFHSKSNFRQKSTHPTLQPTRQAKPEPIYMYGAPKRPTRVAAGGRRYSHFAQMWCPKCSDVALGNYSLKSHVWLLRGGKAKTSSYKVHFFISKLEIHLQNYTGFSGVFLKLRKYLSKKYVKSTNEIA